MSSLINLYYFRNITDQNDKVTNSSLLKNEQNKDISDVFNSVYETYTNPPKKPIVHGM